MPVKQITNEKITSLEDIDKALLSRQAGVRAVSVENIAPGLQEGESIQIEQARTYKNNNEKNVG